MSAKLQLIVRKDGAKITTDAAAESGSEGVSSEDILAMLIAAVSSLVKAAKDSEDQFNSALEAGEERSDLHRQFLTELTLAGAGKDSGVIAKTEDGEMRCTVTKIKDNEL